MYKRIKLLLPLFLFFSFNVFSATYYWVGGSGTWNNALTTNWATSSGGAGSAGFPTSSDNVIFDFSSGLTGATVTVGTSATCNNFTWSATVGTIALSNNITISGDFTWSGAGGTTSGFSDFYIAGNATYNSSMTIGSVNYMRFTSTSTGKTITTNGKTLSTCYFTGIGGGWTTSGTFTCNNSVTVSNGTLNLGNTFSASVFVE